MVIDASAAVRTLVADDIGHRMRARMVAGEIHAPHVFDAEVGQALRRRARIGAIDAEVAAKVLHDLSELVTHRYPHRRLLSAAWGLRHNVSFYDALYVALAAALDLPLVTCDARLARAPGLPCSVELI